MCESVPVAQSVGEEQGRLRPNKQKKEEKTNIGNMATNRTLLELEQSCPAGTSGTAVTPGVTEWSLTPQQLFIKADRLGGDGWGSIYGGEMRPRTVMLYSAKGRFTGQLQLLELTECLLAFSVTCPPILWLQVFNNLFLF